MRQHNVFGAVFVLGIGVFCNTAYSMDLSLDDAVEMILKESQDMKKAAANIKQAEAQLDVANSNRWTNVTGTVSYMNLVNVKRPLDSSYGIDLPPMMGGLIGQALQLDTPIEKLEIPDNIFSAGINVTQPIYTFGKIGNAVRSVKSAIKMRQSAQELTRREVRYSATDLYWTAKMTDEIVKIAQADLRDAQSARNSLTSAGRANRSNLVKIESDIATKEINLSDAKFNRDTAHRMLKILAGIDVNEEIVLTDNFPSEFGDLSAPELTNTPQWQILSDQVKMYEDKAKSQRANGYPTLAATASYSYNAMDTHFNKMFDREGSQSAQWGLALQVPILTGGVNRANATIDVMNAEVARQDLDKAKKITTEEYNRAIEQYDHLRGNLKNLQNARNLAAKAYKYSSERFESGQTSAIELSEVSAGLYQLDMALLNSKYKILMAAESVKKLGE